MYAIILAKGEKSRRLGRIKALIKINGSTIIEKIVNEIKKKVVEDKYKIGPLGWILTGLKNSPYKYNFVIACDYPFVKKRSCRIYDEYQKWLWNTYTEK